MAMALKKPQLYSSLWRSCDELRDGMDASRYKDYVLTLLLMKYVSDRHAGRPDALIDVPAGGGFADIAALKDRNDIGGHAPFCATSQNNVSTRRAPSSKGMMQQLLTGGMRPVGPGAAAP